MRCCWIGNTKTMSDTLKIAIVVITTVILLLWVNYKLNTVTKIEINDRDW